MAVGALTELLGIESVRSIVWTVVWNSISQKMRREGSEGTDEVTVQSMLLRYYTASITYMCMHILISIICFMYTYRIRYYMYNIHYSIMYLLRLQLAYVSYRVR